MISILISFAIAAVLIGFVTIYTGITDYFIQRTMAALAAAGKLRLLRAEFYQPFHNLTKRIAGGLILPPVSLNTFLPFKNKQYIIVRKSFS